MNIRTSCRKRSFGHCFYFLYVFDVIRINDVKRLYLYCVILYIVLTSMMWNCTCEFAYDDSYRYILSYNKSLQTYGRKYQTKNLSFISLAIKFESRTKRLFLFLTVHKLYIKISNTFLLSYENYVLLKIWFKIERLRFLLLYDIYSSALVRFSFQRLLIPRLLIIYT